MKILCAAQLVPDLVEELIIDDEGVRLDPDETSWLINEFDDNAIEQAILMKEKDGGEVVIVAPDIEGADDMFYSASAKGADLFIKLGADFEDEDFNMHALARMFKAIAEEQNPDLILTGVQSHNSLDGALGPILAEMLGLPYIGYISGVETNGGKAVVKKEYPGGLIAEMEVTLPAVLGIQASETPPRYVPFSKVRQASKDTDIDEEDFDIELEGGLMPSRLFLPEAGEKATMIEGDEEEIADKIVEILDELGML